MAESAFQVPTPSEQIIEPERDTQWEEDTAQLKKFGRKPNPAKQNSTAAGTGTLMRVDAPDFEWPQPWHHVWDDQCLPSPAAAHYLIERTNKLWKSELVCSFCILRIFNASELTKQLQATLRPLWFGGRSAICPPLSCVVEVV